MAGIDRLSAWILKHFAANQGAKELEGQIRLLDALVENVKIGDDNTTGSNQSVIVRREPWTYTASVTTRVVDTNDSVGWEPLLSLSLSRNTFRLSRDGLTIETPATIMAAHERRRNESGLLLSEIMAAEGLPSLPILNIRRWESQTTYEIEEPKIISWAYAKGRSRKAVKVSA